MPNKVARKHNPPVREASLALRRRMRHSIIKVAGDVLKPKGVMFHLQICVIIVTEQDFRLNYFSHDAK